MRRRVLYGLLVLWLLAAVISLLARGGSTRQSAAVTARALTSVTPPSGFARPVQCTQRRSFCFRDQSLRLPTSRAEAQALVSRFGLAANPSSLKCVAPIGCTGTAQFHDGSVAFIIDVAFPRSRQHPGTQLVVIPA